MVLVVIRNVPRQLVVVVSSNTTKDKAEATLIEQTTLEMTKLVLHSITLLSRQNSHVDSMKSGFGDGFVCTELFE